MSVTPEELSHDATFLRGVELYAGGRFWDAHEAWERLWRDARDDRLRRLLQGLIQVAAALYKLVERREVDACLRLLARGAAKLEGLPDRVGGVDVRALREGVRRCADAVTRERAAGDRFDRSQVPPIDLTAGEHGIRASRGGDG